MMTMNKILFGGAALFALIGAANAADMATKFPVKAPPLPPTPAYDWSGFYLGGDYGASLSQSNGSTPTGLGNSELGSVDINSTSSTAGVAAGHNLQLSPSWLVGVEGDFGYLGGGQLFLEYDDNIDAGDKEPLVRDAARARGLCHRSVADLCHRRRRLCPCHRHIRR